MYIRNCAFNGILINTLCLIKTQTRYIVSLFVRMIVLYPYDNTAKVVPRAFLGSLVLASASDLPLPQVGRGDVKLNQTYSNFKHLSLPRKCTCSVGNSQDYSFFKSLSFAAFT